MLAGRSMKRTGLLCAAALLGLAGCWLSNDLAEGGSGSESTNGNIVGRVYYADGKPAAQADVIVRSTDYLKDTSNAGNGQVTADAVTDGEGVFHLDSISAGSYALEVRDGKANAVLVAAHVDEQGTTDLGASTLRPVGVLEGSLSVKPDSSGRAYVQIYGLERVVQCDSTGHFSFADLPGGPIQIKPVSPVPGQGYDVPDTIHVNAGQKVQLNTIGVKSFAGEDYSQWPRSRKIYLNTAAAGIRDTLPDYPLLLRLDSTKFDFKTWDIKSVRFADAAGRRLPYEVERYDAEESRAEIWVRLDTLWGDSKNNYINMYWGNAQVPDFSEGSGVFGAFAGVWHLQLPPPKELEGRFPDASPTKADGAGPGPWSSFHDIIGRSPYFIGDQFVSVPSRDAFRPAAGLSISGWAKSKIADVPGSSLPRPVKNPPRDTTGRDVLAMGGMYGLRIAGNGSPYFFVLRDSSFAGVDSLPDASWAFCEAAGTDYRDDKWHHFAAIFDGAYLRLYVDGTEKAKTPFAGNAAYPFTQDLSIGRSLAKGGSVLFRYLDEVRVSGAPWSPGRVQADFQSQKIGSKLAEFK
jgi:hypothetical protein